MRLEGPSHPTPSPRLASLTDFAALVSAAAETGALISLVLSRPGADAPHRALKVRFRPLVLKTGGAVQLAYQGKRQELHENVSLDRVGAKAAELLEKAFQHAHLFTRDADYEWRRGATGEGKLWTRPPSKSLPAVVTHDRVPQRLLAEGTPAPFLVAIGVMNPAGKVLAAKQHKFRQINRYLELVNDVLPHLPAEGPLTIVDYGSGRSYLTFALYHLLARLRGREVRLIGIDRNPDVVRTSQELAARLDCPGLEFRAAEIDAFQPDGPVHLAVSLHACDTATDAALAQGIRWQTPVILAAPCCQHELANKIEAASFAAIHRHGILHERFAALATDALRAAALEVCGYGTQVVEFVELEHTPKNLLLRAVRRTGADPHQESRRREYEALKSALNLGEWALEAALRRAGCWPDR